MHPVDKEHYKQLGIVSIGVGLIIIGVFLSLFVFDSGSPKKETGKNGTNQLPYEFLDKSVMVPYEIEVWAEEARKSKGVFYKEADDGTYFLISAGMRTTTGYSIGVTELEVLEGSVHIGFEVFAPSKEDEVETIEAEAYSYIFIKVPQLNVTATINETSSKAESIN